MLSIAILFEDFPPDPGGIAKSANRICDELDGHVRIQAFHFPRGEWNAPPLWKTQTASSTLTIHSLSPFVNGSLNPPSPSERARVLNNAASRIAAFLRPLKVDVVHGFGLQNAGLVAARVAILLGCPLIQSARGNDAGRNSFDASRRVGLELALQRATMIVAVNRCVRDWLRWHYPEIVGRLLVIPNGVPLANLNTNGSPIEIRRVLGLPLVAPVIGIIGSIREKKNPYLLSILVRDFLKPRGGVLLVLGDIELEHFHRAGWTSNLLDEENVRKITAETPSDLSTLISACDWFVFPSLDDGMANGLLEAMACGRAVICSRVFDDVVNDGVEGVLLPPLCPSSFLQACHGLWNDSQKRLAMGEAAQRMIGARFSLIKERNLWLELYDSVAVQCIQCH
jgi:glycosyltransferase involved in cell wall biosynthesis